MAVSQGSAPPADPADEWKARAEIFEHSYDEVLAATKHQDDKLARSLTAIAFLTAAGVSIFNAVRETTPVLLDGQELSVQAFFFIVFLVAVVLAVAASLAAIGPTRHYGEGGEGWKSLLFYPHIAQDPEWNDYLEKTPEELQRMLAENFHQEARSIAKRVPYKMARSREAAAFITVATMALALLGIFSIGTISPDTRWWIAAGVLFFFSLMPIIDFFQMQVFGFTDRDGLPRQYAYLGISCAVAALLLMLALRHALQWPAVGYTLGVILTSRLSLLSRRYAKILLPASAAIGILVSGILLLDRL
jgi:hypothetical protein